MSVDPDTKRLLREAADRDHGGNVSSLIAELAKDAERRRAAAAFLRSIGVPRMTTAEAATLEREIESELAAARVKKARRRRKAA